MIESIEKKMIRINRKLVKQFGTKEELEKKILGDIKADDNGNVSVD